MAEPPAKRWRVSTNSRPLVSFAEHPERVLAFADFSVPDSFRVYTDASKIGLGGVLTQVDRENVERPVYLASRATSKSEKNYPTTALECLSIVYFATLLNFFWLDVSLLSSQITVRWCGCSQHNVPVCIYAGYCACRHTNFRSNTAQELKWWRQILLVVIRCRSVLLSPMRKSSLSILFRVSFPKQSCHAVFPCICRPFHPRFTHSHKPVQSARIFVHARSLPLKW
jgi:hypothetical protein